MANRATRGVSLALAMIVKDEEKILRRCLDSVAGLVDEMIIVDTGSSDSTKEIAASYDEKIPGGVKVLDFEWCDDFSVARNFGLDHVTSDWVLQLDADEELEASGADKGALESPRINAFWVELELLGSSKATFSAIRLFRNQGDIRYQYPIHEQIVQGGNIVVGESSFRILHHESEGGTRVNRLARNVPILKKALEKDPGSGFFWGMLGNEYFGEGMAEEAMHAYGQALSLTVEWTPWVAGIARDYYMLIFGVGRTQEAMDGVAELIGFYPDFTDLRYIQGRFFEFLGDIKEAKRCYEECMAIGDPPRQYNSLGGTGSDRPRQSLEGMAV